MKLSKVCVCVRVAHMNVFMRHHYIPSFIVIVMKINNARAEIPNY